MSGLTEKFTDLFRDHLFLKTHVHQQLGGLILVVVISDATCQHNMLKVVDDYAKAAPDWNKDPKAKHPKGIKRIYLWRGFLALLAMHMEGTEADAEEAQQQATGAALNTLGSMEEAGAQHEVAAFQCKHKEPKEGRAWTWELTLSAIATEGTRHALLYLVRHTVKEKTGIYIDTKRDIHTNTDKKVWTTLRSLPNHGLKGGRKGGGKGD